MSGFSNSLASNIIQATLNGATFSAPRNRYFALFTSDPGDGFVSGNEVAGAWYVRQLAGTFATPVVGSSGVYTYNQNQVQFPAVTGSTVTVTHIGIVEGSSPTDVTSTLLYVNALTSSKTLSVNDIYVVDTGSGTGDFILTLL